MRRLPSFLAAGLMPCIALAGEAPDFLSGQRTYGSTEQACKTADSDEALALTLSAKGIFGYEFGCNFLDFLPVRNDATGEAFGVVAIAACGDDSGISRPDLFNINVDGNTLFVTSQNAYAAAQAKDPGGQDDPFASGIIEQQFELCP